MVTQKRIRNQDEIFLKYIKIDDFGAYSNRTIGPFTPSLNVVFGNNEAGKTTLNAFVGGVLFGWGDGRSGRNTYRPKNAERAGSLFFENAKSGEEYQFFRATKAETLQGAWHLIEDIDRETFTTMFALTSDELRSLKNTNDVTAKLLTAGSGTNASPSQALFELQTRIAEYTSRAAGFSHSLVQLKQQKEELYQAMTVAATEAERFKKENREFSELNPQREEIMRRLEELNKKIESLSVHKATYERLEVQRENALKKRQALLSEEQELQTQYSSFTQNLKNVLSSLDQAQELSLRDKIDAYAETQTKLEHKVALAKESFDESRASYEAILEADDMQVLEQKNRAQRKVQVALSIILPLVFIVSGVPVFSHGREISSLSFTALGIGLILFAILLASAALVMLFKPNKSDEALQQKIKDTHWVMLQDKKKYEACIFEATQHAETVTKYLDKHGLEKAYGSLKRARSILDEAKDERSRESLFLQKQQALLSQLSSVNETLNDIQKQEDKLATLLSLKGELSEQAIKELIEIKMEQRSALTETSAHINRRFGELKHELSQAKHLSYFDETKLAYQQICTREQESSKELARLLLAKNMLEATISSWESKSQPEVYKQASRLLSVMTEGKWVQVKMTPEGRLQVIDKVKTVREPTHLSLGTCQQLYLSLRIALLMTAENVGHIVPIMADDILVSFDEKRRVGAVQALEELAEKRQVIFFTCHKDVINLMKNAESHPNLVELL